MTVFTRRVASGNFPLYRLIVLGILISGILQVGYWEAPASVANTSPRVFDLIYLAMQGVGALVLLTSLYVRRAMLSLNLERIGGAALSTAGFMYLTAVILNNDGPPLTAATWSILMLSVYLLFRVFYEIPREIRQIERKARRIVKERYGDGQ